MDSTEDDKFIDDYDGLEYNVVSRPQELIDHEKKISTSKILIQSDVDKSDFSADRNPFARKQSNKSREKKGSSRHEKKSSSKEKTSYQSSLIESSSAKKSAVLNKRYENLKKEIYRTLGDPFKMKQRSESLKIQKEEPDMPHSKSKKSNQDQDRNLSIPVSKIMKEPAITAMQRFQVLDARDAALRAITSKPEGSKKIIITGTCPDMCPEKERYGRIAKNCVSVLEMTSTFNPNASSHDAEHSCMVKEYSRSSADQQEPLPHELRPVGILNLTMDYLLCNVVDKYHESISLEDWYDFIWNRTRSIRKDITQQQLCDPTCVEIIEKCVRFHIHCAEALSEEETAVFDPRINNENLTKCLQTLKHMYEDLQSKGIECPNEAEFRSYDILLSLTEGETLRLIKDIRKDLLKSPLIKSAFEAALAFNSDNYVKFFQIIEKANYLSSCILHRYIIKVRSNALQIIVRAYTTQHNTSLYPISRLMNDLKFESEDEAADFCRCHGLEVNDEFITIGRKQFSKSPSGVPVSRSHLLVGQKIGESLGMIINNGNLPLNPKDIYQPHNSFDEFNMLKVDCIGAVKEEIENDLPANKILEQEDDKILEQEDDKILEQEDDKILEQEDEEMETDETLPLPDDSSYNSKIETPLQDSNIAELEKRRTKLLEELNKVESHNSEKHKYTRDHVSKQKEKSKSSKKSHGSSKSHKSVMFSSQNADIIPPAKKMGDASDNFFKPVAFNASSSNKLSLQNDSSFFKFSSATSSKAFDLAYTSNSAKQFALPKTSTTKLDFPVSSTTTTNVFASSTLSSSGFSSQNVGFSFASTEPASFSNIQRFKSDDGNNRLVDMHQTSSSSSKKIGNAELRKSIVQKAAVTQDLVNEVNIDDSESCNKDLFGKEAEMDAENSVCIGDKKVDQMEEEKAIFKNIKTTVVEEETSEFLPEDPRKSVTKTIEESDNKKDLEESRKRHELINKYVDEVAEHVLFEVVEDCSPSICEEVLNDEKRIKAELDNEIMKIREQLARNAIFKWHIFVQKRREKRMYENLAFYSPWQAILLNTPRISSGAISPFVAYKKHCSLTKTTAEILKKRFEVAPGWEKFDAEQLWALNNFKKPHADASYFGSCQIKNFLKLCIVLPHVTTPNMVLFKEWLCSKFGLQKTDSSYFDCRNVFKLHMGKTVIIVRAIELTCDIVEKCSKVLDGVTAMMLFVPHDSEDCETFLKNLTVLCHSSILDSPYPVYLYFMGSHDIPSDITSYIKVKMDLSFTESKIQCIPDINNFVENSQKILNGLMWFNEVKDKDCSLPVLKKISFRQYVEDAFSYIFSILLCKVSLNEYKFLLEDPQYIIDFYNKVVVFRASVLCNDLLKGIHSCWPPEEIKDLLAGNFIDMQTQNLCKKTLENLLLPDFEGDPYEDNTAWEYARLVPSSSLNIVLSIKISNPSVDWVRKIIYCAEHLIQNSDFIRTKGDLPVYYVLDDLLNFDCDRYWLKVLELLPSQNSTKRKVHKPFESCSPLKKSKVDLYQSTPKVYENNFLNIFENTPEEISRILEKPQNKFRFFSDTNQPHPIKEISQIAKSTKESYAFEDANTLNYSLSSMAVGNERKSLKLPHETPINNWTRNTLREINKENNFLEKAKSPSYELSSKAVGCERKLSGLSYSTFLNTHNETDSLNVDDVWKELGIKKPRENIFSSLEDTISDLQYTSQRYNVLEGHHYDFTWINKQL